MIPGVTPFAWTGAGRATIAWIPAIKAIATKIADALRRMLNAALQTWLSVGLAGC
jgi:hypothetical protein